MHEYLQKERVRLQGFPTHPGEFLSGACRPLLSFWCSISPATCELAPKSLYGMLQRERHSTQEMTTKLSVATRLRFL